MALLDPLAPYLGLIKIGIVAALVAGAFLGGCHKQRQIDQAKLQKAATALREASAALSASAVALNEVDALTRAAKHAADVQAKRARDEVVAAQRDAEAYQDQLASIERELEQAKRDPACKQLLEVASCAVLR